MKKVILILLNVQLGFNIYAQTQFWGMTSGGGQCGAGVIFKTDGSGMNETVQQSFMIETEGANPSNSRLIEAGNGKFYGMVQGGGANGFGLIFEYDPSTNTYIKKFDFDNLITGSNPLGSLTLASDGTFYGLTSSGGEKNYGVIFQFDPVNSIYTKKFDFDWATGSNPQGSLIQHSDGTLYGMTQYGGTNFSGVLFQYDPINSVFTAIVNFDDVNGGSPNGSLIRAKDGNFYGMTTEGGANGLGIIFQFDPSSSAFIKKFDFAGVSNGANPYGDLMEASDGTLYGMTESGGKNNKGVLFQYDPFTSVYIKKFDFSGLVNGSNPNGSLMQASDGTLFGLTQTGGVNNSGVLFQFDPITNYLSKKHDFETSTGDSPLGTLMQDSVGSLYGMTFQGGDYNIGALFQFDMATLTYYKKRDFGGAINGSDPCGSLLYASDGMLYGMTQTGGKKDEGVLFQFDPTTSGFIKKVDFDDSLTGRNPTGSLIQARDGKIYGLTYGGGVNDYGTLFQFDPLTSSCNRIRDFEGTANGAYPYGSLIQAKNGKLYGMTCYGGMMGNGVIFEYDPNTTIFLKKLDFNGSNGSYPFGSLIQAMDGMLYGMTSGGGANGSGVLFQFDPSTSTISKKFDFSGGSPNAVGSLVEGNDGKLYGMTQKDGVNGEGIIFQYDPVTSVCTSKFDFERVASGSTPKGTLMQAKDGKLYGMTYLGGINGINGMGVLFEFDPVSSILTKKIDFSGALTGMNPDHAQLIEIPLTIKTASVSLRNCVGSSIAVPYTITGAYDKGNAFIAELSDSTGAFGSHVNIGEITTTSAGVINAVIPQKDAEGKAYRIRVISSYPFIAGEDNGSDIKINKYPDVTTSSDAGTIIAIENDAAYQWLDCQNGLTEIPGAIHKNYKVSTDGQFAVRINKEGCADTSDCLDIKAVGIEELENNKDALIVYPNPNEGKFTVSLNQSNTPAANTKEISCFIMNEWGQILMQISLNSSNQYTMSIGNLDSGIYFILGYNGNQQIRQKIVVTR